MRNRAYSNARCVGLLLLLNCPVTASAQVAQATPRLTGRDSSAYQRFLEETERTLASIEFFPANTGGCPVPQLVQMPFVFKFW
jgi:hypothetical protein